MIHIAFMFKTHSDRFKTDSKNFGKFFGSKYFWTQNVLVSNILGPKFLLDLSYDSKNIHVQNTFRTDSKQIQKNFENFSDQNIFGPKVFLVPNIFGSEFLLDLSYDSHSINVQNTFPQIQNRSKKF